MRVKRGTTTKRRHKKLLTQTKGMQGLRRSSVRKAREAVYKALSYSYRDRRNRKRDFRSLWIARIGAASRANGLPYNEFIQRLKKSNVELDRKVLADLAVSEPKTFVKIVEEVKS